MNRILPKLIQQVLGKKGFTLVELLVVISIIAILAVIGLTVYSGFQKRARDTVRRSDINAISQAMEVSYAQATSGLYASLATGMFATSVIPKDPTGGNAVGSTCPGTCKYCVRQGVATPSAGTCSNTDVEVAVGAPAGGATNPYWVVCTNLESGTYYCRSNQQ